MGSLQTLKLLIYCQMWFIHSASNLDGEILSDGTKSSTSIMQPIYFASGCDMPSLLMLACRTPCLFGLEMSWVFLTLLFFSLNALE